MECFIISIVVPFLRLIYASWVFDRFIELEDSFMETTVASYEWLTIVCWLLLVICLALTAIFLYVGEWADCHYTSTMRRFGQYKSPESADSGKSGAVSATCESAATVTNSIKSDPDL